MRRRGCWVLLLAAAGEGEEVCHQNFHSNNGDWASDWTH